MFDTYSQCSDLFEIFICPLESVLSYMQRVFYKFNLFIKYICTLFSSLAKNRRQPCKYSANRHIHF